MSVLEMAYELSEDGEKTQILRELSALLLTIPASRKTTRTFIMKAIDYIEKH